MSRPDPPGLRLNQPGPTPPVLAQPDRGTVVVTPSGGRTPITGVGDAPDGVPLVLEKGPDGILHPRQLNAVDLGEHTHPDPWGDRIRFAAGPPASDTTAPEGAVHIDTTTGRGWRLRNLEEN